MAGNIDIALDQRGLSFFDQLFGNQKTLQLPYRTSKSHAHSHDDAPTHASIQRLFTAARNPWESLLVSLWRHLRGSAFEFDWKNSESHTGLGVASERHVISQFLQRRIHATECLQYDLHFHVAPGPNNYCVVNFEQSSRQYGLLFGTDGIQNWGRLWTVCSSSDSRLFSLARIRPPRCRLCSLSEYRNFQHQSTLCTSRRPSNRQQHWTRFVVVIIIHKHAFFINLHHVLNTQRQHGRCMVLVRTRLLVQFCFRLITLGGSIGTGQRFALRKFVHGRFRRSFSPTTSREWDSRAARLCGGLCDGARNSHGWEQSESRHDGFADFSFGWIQYQHKWVFRCSRDNYCIVTTSDIISSRGTKIVSRNNHEESGWIKLRIEEQTVVEWICTDERPQIGRTTISRPLLDSTDTMKQEIGCKWKSAQSDHVNHEWSCVASSRESSSIS